jgi:hypothetical protein
MATTRETLLKIAALVNDEGTDEATRAVARLRLEEAYQRNPELFKTEQAPSIETPSFTDVATPAAADDPEHDSFFALSDWGRSTRNPNNLVHALDDDTVVTVFPDRRRPGHRSWCVNRNGTPTYSRHPHPSEIAAMRNCWAVAIAPRRKQGRGS